MPPFCTGSISLVTDNRVIPDLSPATEDQTYGAYEGIAARTYARRPRDRMKTGECIEETLHSQSPRTHEGISLAVLSKIFELSEWTWVSW